MWEEFLTDGLHFTRTLLNRRQCTDPGGRGRRGDSWRFCPSIIKHHDVMRLSALSCMQKKLLHDSMIQCWSIAWQQIVAMKDHCKSQAAMPVLYKLAVGHLRSTHPRDAVPSEVPGERAPTAGCTSEGSCPSHRLTSSIMRIRSCRTARALPWSPHSNAHKSASTASSRGADKCFSDTKLKHGHAMFAIVLRPALFGPNWHAITPLQAASLTHAVKIPSSPNFRFANATSEQMQTNVLRQGRTARASQSACSRRLRIRLLERIDPCAIDFSCCSAAAPHHVTRFHFQMLASIPACTDRHSPIRCGTSESIGKRSHRTLAEFESIAIAAGQIGSRLSVQLTSRRRPMVVIRIPRNTAPAA